MARRLRSTRTFDYQSLEPKRLLATISIQEVNDRPTLVIDGDSSNNSAIVTSTNSTQVRVTHDGQVELFNTSEFERIRFLGRSGNDYFENRTDIDSAAFGHQGNDRLLGGNGNNWIQGGDGNDHIVGGDKNDQLRGRDGDDYIDGGKRHDRIFGGDGVDEIIGRSGDDFIQGEAGNDFIFGLNGDDVIAGGAGNDLIQFGDGNDQVRYTGNHSNYTVAGHDSLFVNAKTGSGGNDRIYDADTFKFADVTLSAANALTAREQVIVRPIIVSNDSGGNTSEFFGNTTQENDVKDLVDSIYAQADIDIVWQSERFWNNTFANVGNGGTRPTSDLNTIVNLGDDQGIGSSDPRVIDMYFLEIVPGFNDLGENFANGLAFLSASGIGVHIGDNLVSFAAGREVISRVVAHEIAHNLGLDHVDNANNLLDEHANGTNITTAQRNQMLASDFSQPL